METYQKHISENLKKLLTVDKVRGHHILEILEYSLLYAVVAGLAALGIEKIFPSPDEQKSSQRIVVEVLLQCMLSAVAVYYIRKVVKIVPYIFETSADYNPHDVMEYNGEIMIAIVFIGFQKNLLTKLDILRKRFISH